MFNETIIARSYETDPIRLGLSKVVRFTTNEDGHIFDDGFDFISNGFSVEICLQTGAIIIDDGNELLMYDDIMYVETDHPEWEVIARWHDRLV